MLTTHHLGKYDPRMFNRHLMPFHYNNAGDAQDLDKICQILGIDNWRETFPFPYDKLEIPPESRQDAEKRLQALWTAQQSGFEELILKAMLEAYPNLKWGRAKGIDPRSDPEIKKMLCKSMQPQFISQVYLWHSVMPHLSTTFKCVGLTNDGRLCVVMGIDWLSGNITDNGALRTLGNNFAPTPMLHYIGEIKPLQFAQLMKSGLVHKHTRIDLLKQEQEHEGADEQTRYIALRGLELRRQAAVDKWAQTVIAGDSACSYGDLIAPFEAMEHRLRTQDLVLEVEVLPDLGLLKAS